MNYQHHVVISFKMIGSDDIETHMCNCMVTKNDALPNPELNSLEGSTMCSCGKLGLERRSRLLAL